MTTIKEMVTSKKFIVFFATVLITFLSTYLGLSTDQAQLIVGTAMAYMVGQGAADIGKNMKAPIVTSTAEAQPVIKLPPPAA